MHPPPVELEAVSTVTALVIATPAPLAKPSGIFSGGLVLWYELQKSQESFEFQGINFSHVRDVSIQTSSNQRTGEHQ